MASFLWLVLVVVSMVTWVSVCKKKKKCHTTTSHTLSPSPVLIATLPRHMQCVSFSEQSQQGSVSQQATMVQTN